MPNYPYTFQLPPLNVQDIPNDGVAGEFLGINGSGVLDWLPAGGGDMLKADNLSGLTSYPTARTNLGLGTGDSPTFANLTLTSPSLSSSAPVTISQTWNGTGSTVFKALVVNATTPGTTSSSSSLLLDLQVGGVSQFSVDKNAGATLSADGVPQLRMISVTGSGSVFNGLTLETSVSTLAGFLVNRSTGEVKIGGLSNGGYFPTFYSNNAERMRITTAGNVGIGTTAPSTLLHLHKDQNTDTELRVQNSSDLSSATATINLVGSQGSTLVLQANPTTVAAPDATRALIKSTANVFGINLKAESTVGTLQFYTGGGAAANERLRITAAGNLGIGTTSPTSNLTVAQSTTGVGTISVGAAGTTITGVGTQFLNTFAVGQTITSAGQTLTISAIASDTSMTISPAAGAAISGQAYTLVGGTRFSVAGNGKVGIGANVFLERDGDNLLALRNSTAAQTFRVYNTYSNAGVDVEYLQLSTSAIGFRVGTNSSGSGSSRPLFLGVGGGSQWQINTAGHIGTYGSDNLYDIGASGANRPRDIYAGGNGIFGGLISALNGFRAPSSSQLIASANGIWRLTNSSADDFNRLQFGGTTDVFPAIARDGAGIKFTGAAAGSTSWIKVPPVAVASLPVAATAGAGARAFVNDASAPVFGTAVTGGGAVAVPVYSTGSAWNVG